MNTLKRKIINKRERYGLTKLGWIFFLLTVIFSFIICIHILHPFLALSARIDGDIMVVEGWLPDYALQKAVDQANTAATNAADTVGSKFDEEIADFYKAYSVLDGKIQDIDKKINPLTAFIQQINTKLEQHIKSFKERKVVTDIGSA